ncbi:MAG: hypothetical protein ACKVQU_36800 [Burkholderiales bacterium]
MSRAHGLLTASVVRSSHATPARRRGQPCTEADQTAADPLISARIVFKRAEPLLKFYVQAWKQELVQQGIDQSNVILDLLNRGVITISQVDTEATVEHFRQMLGRWGVPH